MAKPQSASGRQNFKIRAVQNIDKKIHMGEFYEAHQFIRNLHSRLTSQGDAQSAINLCLDYAMKFVDMGEYAMAVDMGNLMLTSYRNQDENSNEELIVKVLCLFEACESSPIEEKYQLMNRAIKLTRTADEQFGDIRLQRALANAYWNEGKYGLGQGHLLFCKDGKGLANLITQWSPHVYPSEEALLILRVVLMLLSLSDVETADDFIQSLPTDFDFDELAPPTQLAWLILHAVKLKNHKFFELLKTKYQLVIRRDKSYAHYIEEIEKRAFNVRPAGLSGLMSLFSNM